MKPRKPYFAKLLFPDAITSCKSGIAITFDDGPSPDTMKILDLLDKLQIKATFFITGSTLKAHYHEYKAILSNNHTIGNHSYYHTSAFKVSHDFYIASAQINAHITGSKLFRPPYGHLTRKSYKTLKKDFKIILWSYMTYDFAGQTKINPLHIKNGSIIVMHDKKGLFPIIKTQLYKIKNIASEKELNFITLESSF